MNSMKPFLSSLRLSATVVLVVGVLLWTAGTADAQLARRTYTDTLEVHNLNLEVVVSDRDGQRIPGLNVAEASLFVAALDASGGRTEIPATPLLLSSPVPFPSKGLVAHTVTLKLRENTERVSMALYDVYGGKTYTNTIVKKKKPNQQPEGDKP